MDGINLLIKATFDRETKKVKVSYTSTSSAGKVRSCAKGTYCLSDFTENTEHVVNEWLNANLEESP